MLRRYKVKNLAVFRVIQTLLIQTLLVRINLPEVLLCIVVGVLGKVHGVTVTVSGSSNKSKLNINNMM